MYLWEPTVDFSVHKNRGINKSLHSVDVFSERYPRYCGVEATKSSDASISKAVRTMSVLYKKEESNAV